MGINVLSCFDGISCGQIALERAGIPIKNYLASEIDKYCIKVTMDNYPNTIQLGDILNLKCTNLPTIDLVLAGSPCQGFSYAGKGLNFEDSRSKLFFDFVKIYNELRIINPNIKFLVENVNMLQKWQDVISDMLEVKPIFINSRLVSAQDRKRLYWTKISNVKQPDDKNISWNEISEDGWFAGSMRGRRINEFGKRDDYNTNIKIIQHIESRKDNKTNCLTTVGKDNIASKQKVGRTPLNGVEWRYLTRNELEKLQTVPINYTKSVSYNQANKMLGNGWNVDTISSILKHIKN
jgi:site-specific DNA-cytosine methylase